MQQNY